MWAKGFIRLIREVMEKFGTVKVGWNKAVGLRAGELQNKSLNDRTFTQHTC